MKVKFKPKTKLGLWSIGLIAAVPILFFIGMSFVSFYESIPAGRTILLDIVARPGVALSMLAGFGAGIAAFVIGLVSIIKYKERSVFVFLSTLLGFLVFLWILAEIVFPH